MTERNRQDARARRANDRRGFSILELAAVLLILGVLASMAAPRFGHAAVATAEAEGFARRLAIDAAQARRRAIATGDDHYLQFFREGGSMVAYALYRDAPGGAYQDDDTIGVPGGLMVTTEDAAWRFGFDGALDAAGIRRAVRIDGPANYWIVSVYQATGTAMVDKFELP